MKDIQRAKKFLKEHQTKILAGAIVVLAVKNRSLQKDLTSLQGDINVLLGTAQDLTEASHSIVDGIQMMEVDLSTLFGKDLRHENTISAILSTLKSHADQIETLREGVGQVASV